MLWLSLAFAQSPELPNGPTFRDRVEEAVAARRNGMQADVQASKNLLVALEPQVPEEERALYLYQRGLCEDLLWEPRGALAFYDEVIALGPSEVLVEAHLRRALVLEDLGEDARALADIQFVDRQRGLTEKGELTVALQRGITELSAGRRQRGIRHLEEALSAADGASKLSYMRAKAEYALIEATLQEANGLMLRGSQRRVVRNLTERAEQIQAAQERIITLTRLQEPEWVLASLIALGDAYALVGDDLQAAPWPKHLNAIQVRVYEIELAKKVANVQAKALHCYEQGAGLAERLQWESPNARTLAERQREMTGG